jgi:hypothetical protein
MGFLSHLFSLFAVQFFFAAREAYHIARLPSLAVLQRNDGEGAGQTRALRAAHRLTWCRSRQTAKAGALARSAA